MKLFPEGQSIPQAVLGGRFLPTDSAQAIYSMYDL
jgi:hypothetical protein